MWIKYLTIIILIFVLAYLIYKYVTLKSKYNEVKKELNSQSLDYHLKKVKQAGYDFTIKPGKGVKSDKKSNSSKKSKESSEGKKKKSKSFDALLK